MERIRDKQTNIDELLMYLGYISMLSLDLCTQKFVIQQHRVVKKNKETRFYVLINFISFIYYSSHVVILNNIMNINI